MKDSKSKSSAYGKAYGIDPILLDTQCKLGEKLLPVTKVKKSPPPGPPQKKEENCGHGNNHLLCLVSGVIK